ncbi:hypothetical protein [Umezawaea sp. Da 62-37]|uniref:hypothetical protein n=1 Tax=Umezawaea sp. Da 62-37 TaxID=3075927 RepID=UPI0028F6E6B3|nr:hypothetical protein [Umezawaea sp. Da 62-37]WNV85578.1 hypothetical protein RM788_46920 [Umezawaea sp. Da 62-37]
MSTGGFSRWRAELRQRRHHRPFRIAEPEWEGGHRDRLRLLIADLAEAASVAETTALDESALATAATNLWRARKRIAREDSRGARQVGRYLLASQEALDSAGVVVQDHDGDDYHPGLSLEVLVFQEEPELKGEKVLETVRPSIYLGDRRIRMGQVIVGRPLGPDTHSGEEHRA